MSVLHLAFAADSFGHLRLSWPSVRLAPAEDIPNIRYLMDHGGQGTGHGGFTMLELETPFIVCGKGIREGYEIASPMMQYDTPAIAADILGLAIPADWRGRPFPEIYK